MPINFLDQLRKNFLGPDPLVPPGDLPYVALGDDLQSINVASASSYQTALNSQRTSAQPLEIVITADISGTRGGSPYSYSDGDVLYVAPLSDSVEGRFNIHGAPEVSIAANGTVTMGLFTQDAFNTILALARPAFTTAGSATELNAATAGHATRTTPLLVGITKTFTATVNSVPNTTLDPNEMLWFPPYSLSATVIPFQDFLRFPTSIRIEPPSIAAPADLDGDYVLFLGKPSYKNSEVDQLEIWFKEEGVHQVSPFAPESGPFVIPFEVSTSEETNIGVTSADNYIPVLAVYRKNGLYVGQDTTVLALKNQVPASSAEESPSPGRTLELTPTGTDNRTITLPADYATYDLLLLSWSEAELTLDTRDLAAVATKEYRSGGNVRATWTRTARTVVLDRNSISAATLLNAGSGGTGDGLTLADKIRLLGRNIEPRVIEGKTAEAIEGTYRLFWHNESVVPTGNLWYEVFLAGQSVVTRRAWDRASGITMNVDSTLAEAIETASSLDDDYLRLQIDFYDAATGGNVVTTLDLYIGVIPVARGLDQDAVDNRVKAYTGQTEPTGRFALNRMPESIVNATGGLLIDDPSSRIDPTDANSDKLLYRENGHGLFYNRLHPTVAKSLQTRAVTIADITSHAGASWGGVIDGPTLGYRGSANEVWFITQPQRRGFWISDGSGGISSVNVSTPWSYYASEQQAIDRTNAGNHMVIYGSTILYVTGITNFVARFRTWDPIDPLWTIHPEQIDRRLGYDKLPEDIAATREPSGFNRDSVGGTVRAAATNTFYNLDLDEPLDPNALYYARLYQSQSANSGRRTRFVSTSSFMGSELIGMTAQANAPYSDTGDGNLVVLVAGRTDTNGAFFVMLGRRDDSEAVDAVTSLYYRPSIANYDLYELIKVTPIANTLITGGGVGRRYFSENGNGLPPDIPITPGTETSTIYIDFSAYVNWAGTDNDRIWNINLRANDAIIAAAPAVRGQLAVIRTQHQPNTDQPVTYSVTLDRQSGDATAPSITHADLEVEDDSAGQQQQQQQSPGAGGGAREVTLAVYQYGTQGQPAPAAANFVYAAGVLSEAGDWSSQYPSVADPSRPLYRLLLTATEGEAGAAWTVTHGQPEIITHGYNIRFNSAAQEDGAHASYNAATDRYVSFRESGLNVDHWTAWIPIGAHGALNWQDLGGTTAGFTSWTFPISPFRTMSALNDIGVRAIHFGAGYAILCEDFDFALAGDVHLTDHDETNFVAGRTYDFIMTPSGTFFGLLNDAANRAQPAIGIAAKINFRANPLNPSQLGSIYVWMGSSRSVNFNFYTR